MSMFIEISEAQTINRREIVQKGREILEKLNDQLEKSRGEYIVIEVESGDYFIDKSSVKARERMQIRHPNKIFYGAKIGYAAMFKFN